MEETGKNEEPWEENASKDTRNDALLWQPQHLLTSVQKSQLPTQASTHPQQAPQVAPAQEKDKHVFLAPLSFVCKTGFLVAGVPGSLPMYNVTFALLFCIVQKVFL